MPHPKHILAQHGISPKKSLGQNFLHDDSLLANIVTAAKLVPADQVLEIGPGLGALTRHLATAADKVVAIELDRRLMPILREQLRNSGNVLVFYGDVLSWNPEGYFDAAYKVVANIPYYITGAILRHLLSLENYPATLTMTVQKDVAERITAQPGNMSLLAVTTQFYCKCSIAFEIAAGAFWPRPEVDSAVLCLVSKERHLVARSDEESFFNIVRTCFGQKRKQLQKSLRSLGYSATYLQSALAQARIDGRRRPETLSLDDWAAVYQALSLDVPPAT